MTPEQAANHPSKNVISRALGAEDSVEADMKVIEVEDGSAFLLCTDGITRHLPDNEIRDVLTSGHNPNEMCEEMKQRCYQRGAEDNLTAVIVQVGTPRFEAAGAEEEKTLSTERFSDTLEVPSPGRPSRRRRTQARRGQVRLSPGRLATFHRCRRRGFLCGHGLSAAAAFHRQQRRRSTKPHTGISICFQARRGRYRSQEMARGESC